MRQKSYLFVLQEFLVLSRKLKHCSLSKIHQLTIWILRKGLWPSSQVKKVDLITAKHGGFVAPFLKTRASWSSKPTANVLKRAIKTHCMNFPFCLTFLLSCQCNFTEQACQEYPTTHTLFCTIISVPETLHHLFNYPALVTAALWALIVQISQSLQ